MLTAVRPTTEHRLEQCRFGLESSFTDDQWFYRQLSAQSEVNLLYWGYLTGPVSQIPTGLLPTSSKSKPKQDILVQTPIPLEVAHCTMSISLDTPSRRLTSLSPSSESAMVDRIDVQLLYGP